MDKELKEYLNKNMATKDDLKGLATKDDIKNMATKDDLKGLATKSDLKKVNDGLLEYLEHIDETLQEHVHDTKIHQKVSAHGF